MKRLSIALCVILALFGAVAGCNTSPAMQRAEILPSAVIVSSAIVSKGKVIPLGHGSGVIISSSPGHIIIVTAFHVVDEKEITLLVSQETNVLTTHRASLLAVDALHDLALVLVKGESFGSPAPLCTRPPRAFDEVVAIGAPGPLDISPSGGIISDPLAFSIEFIGSNFPMIQHTATTSPGNSGGGLFKYERNLLGGRWCLQGINTKAVLQMPQVNLAVSVDYVRDLLNTLRLN